MQDPETPAGSTSPPDAAAEAAAHAREARLRYVSHGDPGIRRLRKGKGFRYIGPDDRPITNKAELQRVRSLAIPPAYENVWICADPRGHLQAIGVDARGRKQYRYHHDWRAARDGVKFESMVEFGQALPRLRRCLKRDLALEGLPQQKVLAVVVALLDSTLVRVGNAEYARDNKSYGLTTLRDRHVKFINDGRAVLRFRGKHGIEHEIAVNDRRLARIVRHCQQIPGQHLFQYKGYDGLAHPIDSDQVNGYIAAAMGADFTAKDFRTWGATERAIALMGSTPLPETMSETALNACIVATVKEVAVELRNTPAVCRKSYINPVVFEVWRDGQLHNWVPKDVTRSPRKAEHAALAFLRHAQRKRRRHSVFHDDAGRAQAPEARRAAQPGKNQRKAA